MYANRNSQSYIVRYLSTLSHIDAELNPKQFYTDIDSFKLEGTFEEQTDTFSI